MSDPAPNPAGTTARLFTALLRANPYLGPGGWRRAVGDHVARVQAVTDELARVEARNLAVARAVIDESARLTHATLTYAAQFSGAWHRLVGEAAQRTLDLVDPKPR